MRPHCFVVSGWAGKSRLSEFSPDDDGRADFVLRLLEVIRANGVDVVTDPSAAAHRSSPLFELHIEAQWSRFPRSPQILLLIEDRHIRPQNFFVQWSKYKSVFTWDDDLVESRGATKYAFPAHISPGPVGDFDQRPIFLSMVAANKQHVVRSASDLYAERIRTLRWYQNNAPDDLQLFGPGWNLPNHPAGFAAKFAFKLLKLSGLYGTSSRPCWQGIAPVKRDVLLKSRFNLCYENTRGNRGYVSEKLFDALSTGAVPIYWGAPNVANLLPDGCFIDRRKFTDHDHLHRFLRSMTPTEHSRYQAQMHAACISHAQRFGIEHFAQTTAAQLLRAKAST
jgi:alpha(1,3/1,4) fucosyltransferase